MKIRAPLCLTFPSGPAKVWEGLRQISGPGNSHSPLPAGNKALGEIYRGFPEVGFLPLAPTPTPLRFMAALSKGTSQLTCQQLTGHFEAATLGMGQIHSPGPDEAKGKRAGCMGRPWAFVSGACGCYRIIFPSEVQTWLTVGGDP